MIGLVESRFWSKVRKAGDNDCWLWTGATTPSGYGKLAIRRRTFYAHHIALHLSGRPRLGDAITLHGCDNPSCVNPRHLTWGDQQQNMQQALASGRAPHEGRVPGELNGNAKLTADQVLRIRSERGTQKDIAARYGVSRSLIGAIRNGDAWRRL